MDTVGHVKEKTANNKVLFYTHYVLYSVAIRKNVIPKFGKVNIFFRRK